MYIHVYLSGATLAVEFLAARDFPEERTRKNSVGFRHRRPPDSWTIVDGENVKNVGVKAEEEETCRNANLPSRGRDRVRSKVGQK